MRIKEVIIIKKSVVCKCSLLSDYDICSRSFSQTVVFVRPFWGY